MNCPHCKSPNLDNRNYCGSCGIPLGRYCSLCGFRNHLADRFCGGCGASMDGSAVSVERSAPPASLSAPPPTPSAAPAIDHDDQGLSELLGIAATAADEPEEKPDAKVSQDDIDSLFGS